MTLITRISRLFKADLHGILDCLEDPQAVLKQAIRDMEAELEAKEESVKEFERKEAKYAGQRLEREESLKKTEEQISLCFQVGDENLAKSSIRRKLEQERRIKALEQSATELTARREDLQKQIDEQREKLLAVQEKMEIFAETTGTSNQADAPGSFSSCATVSDEEVELAFLNAKRKHTCTDSSVEQAAS